MQLKFLLGALAASSAFAADDDSCSKDLKVSGQSDLDKIKSCETFKGDITIEGDSLPDAELNGVQKIDGSLTIKNATQLKTINAPDLEEISKDFQIQVATVLTHMGMPKLTKVGTLNWVTLPALSGLNFDSAVTNASEIIISDTGLNSLDGINVQKIATFNINNNKYLKEVNVDVASVSNALDISFNAQSVSASFPYLTWANNITFRDVGEIKLPNITNVNASLGFINNTIEGLACPQLKEIGGSLAIVSNGKLSNASFPQLGSIGGGFQVANNTKLKSVLGFPKVKTVGGAIEFTGEFDAASLPSLTLVKGGVEVDSKSDKFNCSSWDKAHKNGEIHGDSYVCKAKKHSTSVQLSGGGDSDSDSTATGSGSGSSTSKGNAVVPVRAEYAPVFGAFAAFIFQYI